MAPFCALIALMMAALMASISLCFSSELKLGLPIVTISAAPAVLPGISPDIAPLLPSPGGELPAPTGSDIPTIPSNPSPPNPDQIASVGPDFAISPTGTSELVSAAFSGNGKFSRYLNVVAFVGFMLYW